MKYVEELEQTIGKTIEFTAMLEDGAMGIAFTDGTGILLGGDIDGIEVITKPKIVLELVNCGGEQ